MALGFRALALASAFAAAHLVSAPVVAAPAANPFAASRYDAAGAAKGWDCRRDCGWGRDRHWRRDRVDAGDVILGAAILGGIIAIASANDRRERERDVVVVERDPRDREFRYDDRRPDDRRAASGLDNAVTLCLDRIERTVRVESVDDVARNAFGWQVRGATAGGAPFTCRIGNDGQIEGIDYQQGFGGVGYADPAQPRADGQWSDQSYAAARAALGGAVRPDMAVQEIAAPAQASSAAAAMPAYPGGPIPGEVIPETLEEATGG
jgi:Ni/Co efflux regulator RcnB